MTTTENIPTDSNWFQTMIPGNKADRARFAALTEDEQHSVKLEVSRLYDGSRTLGACWKIALAV